MSYTINTSHPSPNHSSRHGAPISMLVLHATVGSFASALAWLTNPDSDVSTHYLIGKGGAIYGLVDPSLAAWHAGESYWRGLDSEAIQRGSLGIELENKNDGHDPYPTAQMHALIQLSQDLVRLFHIVPDMIVTHAQIAIPVGRKTDPAGFPMDAFKASLYPPVIRHARVVGVPVYQRSDHTGTLWGYLFDGEPVEIDDVTNGHLADGRGFIDIKALEPLP